MQRDRLRPSHPQVKRESEGGGELRHLQKAIVRDGVYTVGLRRTMVEFCCCFTLEEYICNSAVFFDPFERQPLAVR